MKDLDQLKAVCSNPNHSNYSEPPFNQSEQERYNIDELSYPQSSIIFSWMTEGFFSANLHKSQLRKGRSCIEYLLYQSEHEEER